MTEKVLIRRLPTGVPGLDEVLGGGLPEFSFNLIAGAPGAGKTTLVHQIMFALARPDRPALVFTVLALALRWPSHVLGWHLARTKETGRASGTCRQG